jgi:hypothetical protein
MRTLVLILCLLVTRATPAQLAARPNIVFIMSDDHAAHDSAPTSATIARRNAIRSLTRARGPQP